MKIVEIVPDLTIGGAERFVLDLCNGLSDCSHQVTLITFFKMDGKTSFYPLLSKDVKFVCLDKTLGFSFSLPFKLLRAVKNEKPDVVHTHLNCIIYSILCWLLLRRIKFVHTVHNDARKEAGTKLELFIRKVAFSHFVKPVTISKVSDMSFDNLYKKKATLIYNGRVKDSIEPIHCDEVKRFILDSQNTKQSYVIVNLARFSTQKNQVPLVRAVNAINAKSQKKIDLFLLGSYNHDTVAESIFEEIDKIKTDFIHILGTRDDGQYFLYNADAFCLSSLYEGMPITIIESFANNCPVLTTPVGGVVDMVRDGYNGLLSEDSSEKGIQKMLERFINLDLLERNNLKKNAGLSYGEFSMEKCVAEYIKCFSA